MTAEWINRLDQFDSVSVTLVIKDGDRVLVREEKTFGKDRYPIVAQAMLDRIAADRILGLGDLNQST